MMTFYINNIRVNSIASIGSLNIGNTILSGNRSLITNSDSGDSPNASSQGESITEPPVPGNLTH